MGILLTSLEKSGSLVLIAFPIAALIRSSVGAAVVAMTMAAGIMAAYAWSRTVTTFPFIWPLVVCAINGGATVFSCKMIQPMAVSLLEIDEKTTLKILTKMETIIGITGLV